MYKSMTKAIYKIVFYLWLVLLVSCTQHNKTKLFESIAASSSNIHFSNKLNNEANLNILQYNYFYNGGGVAAADFNNDGLTDLYFSGNQVSGKMYINKGDFSFEDVTEKAGLVTTNWCTGIAVADINNDGLQDMYISAAGDADAEKRKHHLFINKGIDKMGVPVFKDEAAEYGLADTNYTTQAVFVDYDKDGDLDLLLINHYQDLSNPNYPLKKDTSGKASGCVKLYQFDANVFKEVAAISGINENGYSLGVAVSDINTDGWPDIYISKDFVFDDALYINNKNGTFTESIRQYIQHTSQFSMGCDVADFNNDIYPDIITADMLPYDNKRQKLMNIAMDNDRFNYTLSLGYLPQYSRNMLQLNNGPDANNNFSYAEIGRLAGIFKTDWSWSPLFADFDNDGWKDLFISNGIPKDITNNDFISYRADLINAGIQNYEVTKNKLLQKIEELEPVNIQNFIFKNNKDLTFTDERNNWGLDFKGFSNGAVYVDLDNDGDLDIVTNNINAAASVYKNNSEKINKNKYLRISVAGKYAIGATVIISCGNKKQLVENYATRGFQSSQDPVLHFGVDTFAVVDTVKVTWLDGKQEIRTHVKANQLLKFDYSTSVLPQSNKLNQSGFSTQTFFNDITDVGLLNFTHQENSFEDFNYEPLLPHRFSTMGPYIAVADADGNGLQDCWIGGADNKYGKIFYQQTNGTFISRNLPDTSYEDEGGIFFDADGDKDMDLYVVSGGNEYAVNSANYQDRLYINDGKGNFSRSFNALPAEVSSGAVVTACDYDKDGDADIFIGGRVVPGSYAFAPESLLLQNDGKAKFTNITNAVDGLKFAGMVTAAIWIDIDNDSWQDLMITGEWMGVQIFKNDKGILKPAQTKGLSTATGWWNSLAQGDFDKDGDIDFIAGNLGLNNAFNASEQTPTGVYAKDFDNNGYVESILSYYSDNREYTVAGRDMVASVLPSIKKKFDTYGKFATANFNDIFSKEQLSGSVNLKANNFASVYVENKGGMNFEMHVLPVRAQLSPIQTMLVKDFNLDGNLDILLAGNNFGPDFMTGRYDASNGLLLLGNGNGIFSAVSNQLSGLNIWGDARQCVFITINKKPCMLAAINSGRLQVYQVGK